MNLIGEIGMALIGLHHGKIRVLVVVARLFQLLELLKV